VWASTDGWSRRSIEKVAYFAGVKKSIAAKYLTDLVEAGWLNRKTGGRGRTQYQLVLPVVGELALEAALAEEEVSRPVDALGEESVQKLQEKRPASRSKVSTAITTAREEAFQPKEPSSAPLDGDAAPAACPWVEAGLTWREYAAQQAATASVETTQPLPEEATA
jgi:hypothetical protein